MRKPWPPGGLLRQKSNKRNVHLLGIKGVTNYKIARSGKVQRIALHRREFYLKKIKNILEESLGVVDLHLGND